MPVTRQVIVRISVLKWVNPGQIPDISDAIFHCCTLMAHKLPLEVKQNANLFRSRFCYTEATDVALSRHVDSLRAIYSAYANYNSSNDSLSNFKLLSVSEFTAFLSQVTACDRA